jgi:hypothetical protein
MILFRSIHLYASLMLFISSATAYGQDKRYHLADASVRVPVGDFASTHLAGIGLGWQWYSGGIPGTKKTKRWQPNWLAGAEVSGYIGRKETTAGYSFTNKPYAVVRAEGGAGFSVTDHAWLFVAAGPGLGLYRGDPGFLLTAQVGGYYSFLGKWSAGPYLQWMREPQTRSLLHTGVKVGRRF